MVERQTRDEQGIQQIKKGEEEKKTNLYKILWYNGDHKWMLCIKKFYTDYEWDQIQCIEISWGFTI